MVDILGNTVEGDNEAIQTIQAIRQVMKCLNVDSSPKAAGIVVQQAIQQKEANSPLDTQGDASASTSLLQEMRALKAEVAGMQDLLRQSDKMRRLEFALVNARSFYPMLHPTSGKTIEPKNLQRVYTDGATNGRFYCHQFIITSLSIFRRGLGVYLPTDVIYANASRHAARTPLTRAEREAARVAFRDILVHHFHFLLGSKPRLVEDDLHRTMIFYD